MATFNFNSGTTIVNSKMADTINNVELTTSGEVPDKEAVLKLLQVWKERGLPIAQYSDLRAAVDATPAIGKNSQTRILLEKVVSIAKTGGAAMETYAGLSALIGGLYGIFA